VAIDPFTLGLSIFGGQLASSYLQSRAASRASAAQQQMSQEAIEAQEKQFEETRKLLEPYVAAGYTALERFAPYITGGERAYEQQAALAGLSGPEAQRAALEGISGGAGFQEAVRQGEEAMLARASATGGLRGGNIQGALAQFRPQMLQQAIEQQYGRLGGLAGAGLGLTSQIASGGQAAATGAAQAGQASATNIGNLLAQQGAAQAGGIIGGAAPYAQMFQLPAQLAGLQLVTGRSLFGGAPAPRVAPGGP
jgi:hypothetical protein